MHSETSGPLVLVVVERDETRIWQTDAQPGTKPEHISLPEDRGRHHHMRQATHSHGHDTNQYADAYYEKIAEALSDAGGILFLGHGNGKANSMMMLAQYLAEKHKDISRRIVGMQDINMQAVSEPQLLKIAQGWSGELVPRRTW